MTRFQDNFSCVSHLGLNCDAIRGWLHITSDTKALKWRPLDLEKISKDRNTGFPLRGFSYREASFELTSGPDRMWVVLVGHVSTCPTKVGHTRSSMMGVSRHKSCMVWIIGVLEEAIRSDWYEINCPYCHFVKDHLVFVLSAWWALTSLHSLLRIQLFFSSSPSTWQYF